MKAAFLLALSELVEHCHLVAMKGITIETVYGDAQNIHPSMVPM